MGAVRLVLDGARVVVADEVSVIAPVFSAPAAVGASAQRLVLFAIGVAGVPDIAVEEALWTAWDVVGSG